MAAETVKAVRVMAYHVPMEMQDVPIPTLQSPFDVIVKVGAAGVCRTDIHICDGEWKEKSNVELPYTIGHENAGWVHEVGSSVSNVKVGDKVILHPLMTCGLCTACRFGDDVHCGKQNLSVK
jgi:NAD+-dependent secondary alcohol dehydrogenase Adh1